jgi:hypothetical protein
VSDSRIAEALQRSAKSTKTLSGLIGQKEQRLIELGMKNPIGLSEVRPEHIRISMAAKLHSMTAAITSMAARSPI